MSQVWQIPVRHDQRAGVAGLGEFGDAGDIVWPGYGQAAAGEGDVPSGTGVAGRWVRRVTGAAAMPGVIGVDPAHEPYEVRRTGLIASSGVTPKAYVPELTVTVVPGFSGIRVAVPWRTR